MTQSDKSAIAAEATRRIRSAWIDLSHKLPQQPRPDILRAWVAADAEILKLQRLLEGRE